MRNFPSRERLRAISLYSYFARISYDLNLIREYADLYHLTVITEQVEIITKAYERIDELANRMIDDGDKRASME